MPRPSLFSTLCFSREVPPFSARAVVGLASFLEGTLPLCREPGFPGPHGALTGEGPGPGPSGGGLTHLRGCLLPTLDSASLQREKAVSGHEPFSGWPILSLCLPSAPTTATPLQGKKGPDPYPPEQSQGSTYSSAPTPASRSPPRAVGQGEGGGGGKAAAHSHI